MAGAFGVATVGLMPGWCRGGAGWSGWAWVGLGYLQSTASSWVNTSAGKAAD